jgi:hypothetical protein
MSELNNLISSTAMHIPLPQYDHGTFYTLVRTADGESTIRIHHEDGSTCAVVERLTDEQALQYVRRLEEADVERAGENTAA